MDEIMNLVESLFRWLHVLFGVIWIGHLYFFNWVNANFNPTMDAETKKKVVPELMPRALYWFRWGAAFTWITGFFLLGMVYYMNKTVMFGADGGWTAGAGIMVLLTFLAAVVYDFLYSNVLKDPQQGFFAGIVLAIVMLCLFYYVGGMEYRAYAIHLGATFGTIMAFNVWMRIWPAQQKIITATKNGEAPDAALVALAGTRSKHNTYMSVPLLFLMVGQHGTWAAAHPVILGLIVAAGFGLVYHLYERAKTVKGF